MTVHSMLQQVGLFSSGKYRREGDLSILEIPLPGGRKQSIYGKVDIVRGERVGLLYTNIGALTKSVDLVRLLEINAGLRYSRIAVLHATDIVLIGTFELDETSIRECAPILQEMAAIADELERLYFETDES
jgi:hypothetical protein